MFTRTLSPMMPALFTSMCRSPKASRAAVTTRWPPSQSETSSVFATASPPSSLISSTTFWAVVRSSPEPFTAQPRSLTTTLAPSLANNNACSRPIPRPAPVMIATLPSSAPMTVPFFLVDPPPPRSPEWVKLPAAGPVAVSCRIQAAHRHVGRMHRPGSSGMLGAPRCISAGPPDRRGDAPVPAIRTGTSPRWCRPAPASRPRAARP